MRKNKNVTMADVVNQGSVFDCDCWLHVCAHTEPNIINSFSKPFLFHAIERI